MGAGAESFDISRVDMGSASAAFRPPVDVAAHSALPGGLELTGHVMPTGMEAQAMAAIPPVGDASALIAAAANDPISPVIQLIMRMPGAMGLMNSFFEALSNFFFTQSPLAGLFDPTLFAQLGAVARLGVPIPGAEHAAFNLGALPGTAPIFSTLGMGAHSFASQMMPFDALASKITSATSSLHINASPEHFSNSLQNGMKVSGTLDLNKPQFEWSSKYTGQTAGGSYGEMLSGPQLSDSKLASHLGGTQRLFSDKLATSGMAMNRMPMNAPTTAANSLNHVAPTQASGMNVGGQTLGQQPSGMSAAGSFRDSMPAASADNNVGFRMNGGGEANLDMSSNSPSMDGGSDKLLAMNNNTENFRPTLGGLDKAHSVAETASKAGSQWNQPQSMASEAVKPGMKMEGLRAKQLTFDSLKDGGKGLAKPAVSHAAPSANHAAPSAKPTVAHDAPAAKPSVSHDAPHAKPTMDHQGHQTKIGHSNSHAQDHVSHRSLPKVEYQRHEIASKPTHDFRPKAAEAPQAQQAQQADAAQQPEAGQHLDAQGNPVDAPQVAADAPATPATTAAATPYTIRAGDNLWNIAKNQLGDGTKWKDLFAANKDIIGSNPDMIHPGAQIELPGAASPEVASASTYVVKPGDSLWKISEELLGDGTKWQQLYQANAELIGGNPRLIMPGQELTIPGMEGADAAGTLAQNTAGATQQTAQAAQGATQAAQTAPVGDAQQLAVEQPVQAQPQVQEIQAQPEPQAMQAQAAPQAQPQFQQAAPQAPQQGMQMPAAQMPSGGGKDSILSSTMVPTDDIVNLFRKAK